MHTVFTFLHGYIVEIGSCLLARLNKFHFALQINLHEGTEVNFAENRAESGGGIYVEHLSSGNDVGLLSLFNTLCFLQFELDRDESKRLTPDEWKVMNYRHNFSDSSM